MIRAQPPLEQAAHGHLLSIYRSAIAAVDAEAAVARMIHPAAGGAVEIDGRALEADARLVMVAVGKAAAPMARAVLRAVPEALRRDGAKGDPPGGVGGVASVASVRGLVVTKDGHGLALPGLRCLEAAHPVPDARSEAAGRAMLSLVQTAAPEDVLLLLISGGASALCAVPAEGLERDDLARCVALLLAGGADIGEMNCVRKHLSAIAGGRLADATSCRRIEVLAVSDVMGDALDVIGSGLCVPDPTRFCDALAVLVRRDLLQRVPDAVRAHLERGAQTEAGDSSLESRVPDPRPGTGRPGIRVDCCIVARNADAREAACRAARSRGLRAIDLGEILCGEARLMGARLAGIARAIEPGPPTLLVAGGETTVHVTGPGRGGRSQELALAAALELEGAERVVLLAGATDGGDGPTDAAGAIVDGATTKRGRERGLEARRALAENDSYGFFDGAGGLLRTGPTHTNVMDLVLVAIDAG